MARKSLREMGAVEQLSYPVSEQNPIRASVHKYGRSHEKPHFDMHYVLEVGIVLSGCVCRYYQETKTRCSAGDVWFCGMWEPHGSRVLKRPAAGLVLVLWPPMLAKLFFPEAPEIQWQKPFAVPVRERPKIPKQYRGDALRIARRMERVIAGGGTLQTLRLRLLLLELLLLLLTETGMRSFRQTVFSQEMYNRISPALDLVFHSRAFVTSAEGAGTCKMSLDLFVRHFHRLMGVSFAKFALRHRIGSAAEQLLGTNDPVKTVAYDWGFKSGSHLHRLFVQHYDCTPSKYRLRFQRGPGKSQIRISKLETKRNIALQRVERP